MDIVSAIFSGPGATIVVCATVLILTIIYVKFPDRFRGLSLGYKDLKLETPRVSELEAVAQASIEVIESPSKGMEIPKQDQDRHPLTALYDAVEAQDRKGIEAAYEKLRENPPFGFSAQQLETFKFNELLRAGFSDTLTKLKEIEDGQVSQIQASLYLTRYYFNIRSFDDAERHLAMSLVLLKMARRSLPLTGYAAFVC